MALSSTPPHFRIPVVAVFCAAVFIVYGLVSTAQESVTCSRLSPGQVQCQVARSLLFGRLPTTTTQFHLRDIAIDSTMCDNTPRGGVRFCHRVTLLGNQPGANEQSRPMAQPLPEMRTPLSATTVRDQFLRFINGEGEKHLTFTLTEQLATHIRTGVLGLLLAIAAWGFWDIQWPPVQISPLAMDGAEQELPP